jgi:hypothetical protein
MNSSSETNYFAMNDDQIYSSDPVPASTQQYRNYSTSEEDPVKAVYRKNHIAQTYEKVLSLRKQHCAGTIKIGLWKAMELLNEMYLKF